MWKKLIRRNLKVLHIPHNWWNKRLRTWINIGRLRNVNYFIHSNYVPLKYISPYFTENSGNRCPIIILNGTETFKKKDVTRNAIKWIRRMCKLWVQSFNLKFAEILRLDFLYYFPDAIANYHFWIENSENYRLLEDAFLGPHWSSLNHY